MLIDLSHIISEQTPVYPGDPTTKVEPAGILEKDGFCDHLISMGTHVGTHIDAPMHMVEGGKSLDQIPIDTFIGQGKLIEVASDNFEEVKAADIQEGDIVLLKTGMSEKYYEPVYFESYPAMSQEIAEYLVEKKIKMVGLDTCSADNKDGFPIRKTLLSGGVLIIENLTDLSNLQGSDFKVYALPLNLEIDGAPARVVAEIV